MTRQQLSKHIRESYLWLRVGMGVMGFIYPLVLLLAGLVLGLAPKTSMSAYFHSPMRDIFVGFLFAIGTFLFLYRGFSDEENNVLNIAGIFSIFIAVFPMEGLDLSCELYTAQYMIDLGFMHGISAIIFFLAIAYVCLFRASDTLVGSNVSNASLYRLLYRVFGVAMIVLPLLATILLFLLGEQNYTIFVVEVLAVWVFSAYWLVKSCEIYKTNIDSESLDVASQI